jgi:hypothetical protein
MGMDAMTMATVGGALAGTLLAGRQKAVTPPVQQAAPAPQPSRMPDPTQVLQDTQAQAAGTPGLASTFLSGPQGVDPTKVKTTRTSLYGS